MLISFANQVHTSDSSIRFIDWQANEVGTTRKNDGDVSIGESFYWLPPDNSLSIHDGYRIHRIKKRAHDQQIAYP